LSVTDTLTPEPSTLDGSKMIWSSGQTGGNGYGGEPTVSDSKSAANRVVQPLSTIGHPAINARRADISDTPHTSGHCANAGAIWFSFKQDDR